VSETVLEVRHLEVAIGGDFEMKPVDDVSFSVEAGEIFGIVGESGCGKSMTALAVQRLLPPTGRIVAGHILLGGTDLAGLSEEELRQRRGAVMSMIFQDPLSSLNPLFTVGDQVAEPLLIHQGMSRGAARARVLELLRAVGIADPERRIDQYPYELSGGMRQRVMIAMAIACNPRLLIADEPTTALDVTIQAQILALLSDRRRALGMAMILITHDLGVIAQHADRLAVMYAGRIVETGTTEQVFAGPSHPYTEALMRSIPALAPEGEELPAIPGTVPALSDLPPGCRFAPRCAYAVEACVRLPADFRVEVAPGHSIACLRFGAPYDRA
jgi:oligopeptide/dipeptide ABC transporter ATP-binding protein